MSFYSGMGSARTIAMPRSIVFYYGEMPAPQQLSQFEFAVLEPDSGFEPLTNSKDGTHWIAYVSVGEVLSSREYYSSIPKSWIIGRNIEWHSQIIDQAAAGWPSFFVENVIAPLWKQGYRGFFLDTLDSYQLVIDGDAERQKSRQGLIDVIHAMHDRFPEARIILNRGFELLPDVHKEIYAIAFESLFKGWSQADNSYIDVSPTDRAWLLDQVKITKQDYGLPVIAIDYCLPADTVCSKDTVKRIKALGIVPYVGDGHLLTVNSALSHK